MSNQKTVKIDPASLKIGTKKEKTNKIRLKPQVSSETNKNINKVKLELLKKVKDYHKDKEVEKLKEDKKHEKNLEKHEIKADFETEFNKSLNFLRDLSNKNREKKKKKKLTNKISNNIEVDVNLSNELKFEPNYGCLKNGSKPTYRELNKTYKNLDKEKNHIQFNNMLTDNLILNNDDKLIPNNNLNNNEKLVPNNTSNNDKKLVYNNSSNNDEKLVPNNSSNNDEKLLSNNSSNNDENLLANNNLNNILFNELTNDSNNNLNLNLNYDKNLLADNKIKDDCNLYEEYTNINKELKENNNNTKNKNIPKINRITRKFKYNIGKLKNKNQVGIIIKNRYTLKQIKDDISSKKNKPIQDIKNELRKLNLIKLGTEAPNDVLRQIYENAILCGDIKNTNYSNFIHNYDNDENNF